MRWILTLSVVLALLWLYSRQTPALAASGQPSAVTPAFPGQVEEAFPLAAHLGGNRGFAYPWLDSPRASRIIPDYYYNPTPGYAYIPRQSAGNSAIIRNVSEIARLRLL